MTLVRPLTRDDVPSAAELLAQRHRRHRASSSLLDGGFEQPTNAAREVARLLDGDGASGAVAVRDGRVVGYVLGSAKDPKVWGANVWVESAGMALAEGEKPETARDLYACAAQRWADEGRTAHYAVVPAHDVRLVDAWFRLCFGLQHVHAARLPAPHGSGLPGSGLPGSAPSVPARDESARARVPASRVAGSVATRPTTNITTVRRAVRADVAALGRLDLLLPEHQSGAPVFAAGRPSTLDESVAEWEQSVDDERFTTFVAQVDGEVVGSAIGCALGTSSLHTGLARPDGAAFLGFAAVLPQARRRGVGRALGEAVIEWAGREGYRSVVTDWRATNLLASRAWPRLGFEPTFLRLHRSVGH